MCESGGVRVAAFAALLALSSPAAAEPGVSILPIGFEVREFRGPESRLAQILATSDALRNVRLPAGQRLAAAWGPEGAVAFAVIGGALRRLPLGASAAEGAQRETVRGAVPHSRLQTAGPVTVHLSDPTQAYRHGALGDAVEAANLTIVERQPVRMSAEAKPVPTIVTKLPAGEGAVFEDLEPRLADLDRDGTPEIMVVKSYFDRGSALAVIGKKEGAWAILAETPPIGAPNRWLNPAAIADFDGDGRPEIALVRTPHLGGMLQVWRWEGGGTLALAAEKEGYSNHALGSTALDNAAAVDVDGDGTLELVVPTADRSNLAILSLKGGIRELKRHPLPGLAGRGLAALGSGKATHILVALADGRIALVRP